MKNIGQTSQLTGLSQRMLRYFEEQDLLKPNRSQAGSRLFSDKDIAEILRIRKLHELGFTYPEIKGSPLMVVFHGKEKVFEYESAWQKEAKVFDGNGRLRLSRFTSLLCALR